MARNEHDGRSLEERLASLDAMSGDPPPAEGEEPQQPGVPPQQSPDQDATVPGEAAPPQDVPGGPVDQRAPDPWLAAPPTFQQPPAGYPPEGFGPPQPPPYEGGSVPQPFDGGMLPPPPYAQQPQAFDANGNPAPPLEQLPPYAADPDATVQSYQGIDPATGQPYPQDTDSSGQPYVPIDPNTGQPYGVPQQYQQDPNATAQQMQPGTGQPYQQDPGQYAPYQQDPAQYAPMDPNMGQPYQQDPAQYVPMDPNTGQPYQQEYAPVDPNTGQPYQQDPGQYAPVDPNTGQPYQQEYAPVDPNTGQPYQQDPAQYAPVDPNTGQPYQQADPNLGQPPYGYPMGQQPQGGYPQGPGQMAPPPQGYVQPPQQGQVDPQNADSLSSENLLGERRIAPSSGWRRAVYKATGGSIHPGESQGDLRRKDLIARTRTQVAGGHHRVAVMSLKGGVGKTTTTTGLGSMLGSLRGDTVIAVDANPDRGTLSDKVRLETAATVRDLLNNRDKIQRYADVRAFTSQNGARLEVLASDRDPAVSEAFSADDYAAVAVVLEQYYSICITDCGTGLLHSAMAGVLSLADQLVLVSSPSVDGARSASATLDWLEAHDHGHLVRNGVVVLSMVRNRTRSQVDLDKLQAHFESRCRAVVRVPYDDHLEEGAEVDLDQLAPSTREAYLELAAVVGDGLAFQRPTPPEE